MIIFHNQPRTLSYYFQPYRPTPSIAYWLLQPKYTASSNSSDKKSVEKSATKLEHQTCDKKDDTQKEAKNEVKYYTLEGFDIHEEEDQFILSTDLPGVKQSDLKVEYHEGALRIEGERIRGTKKAKIRREIALDEHLIDTAKLSASLADGTLTIEAPKAKEKSNEPKKVAVSTQEYKEKTEDERMELSLDVDLPGVAAGDLEVTLSRDGELRVFGERKRGKTSKVNEAFMLNTRKVDTSKMNATLSCGVLSIRAPAREIPEPKAVPVNGKMPKVMTVTEPTSSEEAKQDSSDSEKDKKE